MPHGGLVAYQNPAGQSGNGRVLAAVVVPQRAAIQEKRRLLKGLASEEVSTAQVWLDPEHTVEVGASITIWLGTDRERVTEALAVQFWEHGPGLPAHIQVDCQ